MIFEQTKRKRVELFKRLTIASTGHLAMANGVGIQLPTRLAPYLDSGKISILLSGERKPMHPIFKMVER